MGDTRQALALIHEEARGMRVGEKFPSLAELRERGDLSPSTLIKAFRILRMQGRVESVRGPRGGYFLLQSLDTDTGTPGIEEVLEESISQMEGILYRLRSALAELTSDISD